MKRFGKHPSLLAAKLDVTDEARACGVVDDVSMKQPGDPAKLAKALLTRVGTAKPPLRLPLGPDTVAAIGENRFVAGELSAWRSIAVSTNHDDV